MDILHGQNIEKNDNVHIAAVVETVSDSRRDWGLAVFALKQ